MEWWWGARRWRGKAKEREEVRAEEAEREKVRREMVRERSEVGGGG